MKTLLLKHKGFEAHVPYALPDSLRFDCFVPAAGICEATVDVRAETIEVLEVCTVDGDVLTGGAECMPEVLEQAGDVVRTFFEALPIEWSDADITGDESAVACVRRLNALESAWRASAHPSDLSVLSTIAEMAVLESDLHTAWSRLPVAVTELTHEPVLDPRHWHATKMLSRFVTNVLAPRAQDLATAAAKRRLQDWVAEEEQRAHESARSERTDFRIQFAKERA